MMTENEIFDRVRDILVDALGIEPEAVAIDARLADDLGAESLDYLDIGFRMEKAFGISMKGNEMLLGDNPGEGYVQDGKVTDAGMQELRRRLPHARFDRLEESRDVRDFRGVFTVGSLVQFVKARIAQADAQPVGQTEISAPPCR
jgi:acyl carrier protein